MKKQESGSILRIAVEWILGIEDEEDGIYTKRPWIAKRRDYLSKIPVSILGEPPPSEPKSVLWLVMEVLLGTMTIFALGCLLFILGYIFTIPPSSVLYCCKPT